VIQVPARRDYRFEPVTGGPDELDETCALFRHTLGFTPITPAYLDWQYNRNPYGLVVGFNALFEGRIVSHLVSQPMRAVRFGESTKGLLLINLVTHPDHQMQGLFTALAERLYARGEELGFEFVVGVANGNAVHGWTRKLGCQLVAQLETRLVATVRLKSETPRLEFVREWDLESVRWRMQNPLRSYAVRPSPAGIRIHSRTERFPALVGLLEPGQVPAEAPLDRSRIPMRLWIGIDPAVDWGRSIQLKLPDWLRRVPLNLIYRDLRGTTRLDPGAVRFWAMDFDAY